MALYLARTDMISGYGPIGAAMLFWVYVSSIIILLGAELAYAVAKERGDFTHGKRCSSWWPRASSPPPGSGPKSAAASRIGTAASRSSASRPSPVGRRSGRSEDQVATSSL